MLANHFSRFFKALISAVKKVSCPIALLTEKEGFVNETFMKIGIFSMYDFFLTTYYLHHV